METAVKAPSTTSDTRARSFDGVAARRSTPTPALPPIPCMRPIPKAASGVRAAWRPSCDGWRWRTSSRTARKTISAPTAVSAPRCTVSGRNASDRTIGTPKATSVSA